MRIFDELPVQVAKYLYHSSWFTNGEVRKLMSEYGRPNIRKLNPNHEYAVSFHNHSCDGNNQNIGNR